ncbi:MAG: HNH endonuclease [Nocardioidaceae bacterium]|uniref:HNH nuclease domain-containing protein n=1 Tax=Janibacter cremeus TaxID=1285192 RepID=A0A852VTB0_9MICO|nr:HNH endonuclease signature motif containing protein [Janibacter cremeus]MDN5744601.1 HNH endonuclease [Nocardioidaceae bacterium]NYF97065.1 hypothetical protein [Janibacter cremeus]
MFEEELALVEESFRGLSSAREGVSARGGRADERTLTQVLETTERLRRAADALELSVIGQAVRWGEERGPDGIHRAVHLRQGEVAEFAVEAVGVTLRASTFEARDRCDLAARAVTDLHELADLIADGRLRERAMGIVAKETRLAEPHAVVAVVEHLLAPMRGRPDSIRIVELEEREIRKACRRILQRAQPDLLSGESKRNRREQLDARFSAGPVGTTDLHATLPSEIGLALKCAIDEAAAQRLTEDPDLTAGAARAWGLADLALSGVEVSAQVRLGIPVITSAASRIAFAPYEGGERAHGDQLGTTIGQDLHGPTAREGRLVTGDGADAVDVIAEEWAGDAVTSQVPASLGPNGSPTWVSGCDIPGVGYIPPDAVAAIVSNLETRVSRALLDARTGTLVETSNPRYVITDSMREFVAARDEVCRMWGCHRRVRKSGLEHGADLDHATPWPAGPSTPANLSGLCRHHHRLKHSARWTHRQSADGTSEWISPGGVAAMTFPAQWIHTEDEGGELASPPSQGANIDWLAAVVDREPSEKTDVFARLPEVAPF